MQQPSAQQRGQDDAAGQQQPLRCSQLQGGQEVERGRLGEVPVVPGEQLQGARVVLARPS